MEYLPLFVDLKNKLVLVIGGGIVAVRKIQILQSTGAFINVVARALCPELKNILLNQSIKNINWIGKDFRIKMLNSVVLVIVATNDDHLNALIYKKAKKRLILINTVDDKDKCSCIFPAIVDRSPVLVGISSCGRSPVLTRILREKLELFLPFSIALVAKLAGKWRNTVKEFIKNIVCRRIFWEKLLCDNSYFSFLIEQNKIQEADKIIEHTLYKVVRNSGDFNNEKKGMVTLVGAGPGDKGLLTIRGLQIIQRADVILYDYLINMDILDLARRDADKICVGKRANQHTISQQKLNNLIVELAQKGLHVARLKGGDPFIFGRGGEELQKISESGIAFQVIPGITAGIGAAAYSGIPLTHREYARSVIFITGHRAAICYKHERINWCMLSDTQQTLVIYMGKMNAEMISKNLILHGRNANTPVAVISHGTYLNQKVLVGVLIELGELVQMVNNPILIIVGEVVLLRKEINWC